MNSPYESCLLDYPCPTRQGWAEHREHLKFLFTCIISRRIRLRGGPEGVMNGNCPLKAIGWSPRGGGGGWWFYVSPDATLIMQFFLRVPGKIHYWKKIDEANENPDP